MSLLQIDQLDVRYGQVRILHGISLHVQEGEFVGIVGPNGAGKTTLLKAISRLVDPTDGKIIFDGQPLCSLNAADVVNLGLIQVPEGRHLFPYLSVLENLLLGGYAPRARLQRAASLEQVYEIFPRLKERAKQKAGTLSGGERQMVAIARSLMARPRLLMLDEPSLGLAPILVDETFSVIDRINQQGVTVLLVEQNVQECLMLAQRAYALENGQLVREGTGHALLNDTRIKQAYLGL